MKIPYISKILFLCVLNCCFVNSFAGVRITDAFSDEDLFLRNKYREMDVALKGLAEQTFKYLLPNLQEASEIMNLSAPCMGNFLSIGLGVRKLEKWALQYLDATGKINDGMMNFNPHMVGNFDQCLSATSKKKNGMTDFHGRHCLVRYRLYLPDPGKAPDHVLVARTYENTKNLSEILQYAIVRLQEGYRYANYYGLCVPSGCDSRDVKSMLKYAGDKMFMNLTLEYCQVQSDTSYLSTRKIVIICIFAFLGLIGIISSATEYYSKANNVEFKGKGFEILRCFSIIRNFPKLLNTKTDTQVLSCIAGIRVLSTFYIILCHKFVIINAISFASDVLPNVFYYVSTLLYQIIMNGFLCVETFVFMSGFLNIYLQMQLAGKGKKINWMSLLIHRLWRIYPAYIITILFLYLLTPRGPIGPFYNQRYIEDCNDQWWKNLIFINNFYPENKCLEHTWFIACDMQYFLLSLITIPILMKNPKKGILVNAAIVVCGLLITILWISLDKIGPSFIFVTTTPRGKEEILRPYMSSTSHVSTYFLGILMGYFMSTKKNIKISKVHQALGWLLATLTYTSMLFMTYRWNSGALYTTAESALYFSLSKPLCGLAVGWLMFCCINGHGSIINYILSLKMWIPLSRLSFTIYLFSFPLQLFHMTNRRTAADTEWMIWIWDYVADVCISCLLALAISVLMESPLIALEKLVFTPKTKDNEKKAESLKSIPLKENITQEKNTQIC